MTTDDLRTRAREAAEEAHPEPWPGMVPMAQFSYAEGYAAGYLARAAQQPSREELVRVMREAGLYRRQADAILALFENGGD